MKKSKYTTILNNGGEFIIYNSLHDKVLRCTSELIMLLKEFDRIDTLKEIHPTFYQRLCDDGFIVPDEDNEVQKVIDDIIKEDDSDTHYSITVNPTMNCNLKCWYCYEEHLADSNMPQDILNSTKKLIENIVGNGKTKSINLSFFGGEPLLGFKKCVKPLIEHTRALCKRAGVELSLGFTTNAVLLTQEIVDFLRDTKLHVLLQIPFDGDRDIHNSVKQTASGEGVYDIMLENLKVALAIKDASFIIRCNYTRESAGSFEKLIDNIAPLYKKNDSQISFSFQRVWQDTENKETEKIIEALEKKVDDLGADYYLPSIDKSRCYADKRNAFVINFNGDVYQCTAREFNDTNKEGHLLKDGSIEYNERYHERMKSRFSNSECLECVIYPICNICTQKRMEMDNTKCILQHPEMDRVDKIRSRISTAYEIATRRKQCGVD